MDEPIARWDAERALAWERARPWIVGCNYVPAYASNTLEQWQGETFEPAAIRRELGWAAAMGLNSVRTNLHHLVWETDSVGLLARLEAFLQLASSAGISVMPNFFDDCCHSGQQPRAGRQEAPVPGVHNSRWVPSPAHALASDPAAHPRLEAFVRGVVGKFARDARVLCWDLYNEPGNGGMGDATLVLHEACFRWAREAGATQPLTTGIWDAKLARHNALSLALSDVVTFHNYGPLDNLQKQVAELRRHGRPVLVTEWMARTRGSEVATHLPYLRAERVGCYHWGLVNGRTQTQFPWGSPPGAPEPDPWFHDLLRMDGSPYRPAEIELFRALTRR